MHLYITYSIIIPVCKAFPSSLNEGEPHIYYEFSIGIGKKLKQL